MLSAALSLVCAAGPFPLPSLDGKPLSAAPTQTTFRVPLRFERLRAFYEAQFPPPERAQVRLTVSGPPGRRVLTIVSSRAGEPWRRAIVREGEVDSTIEVTPLLRLDEAHIEGTARPVVQVVIGRSPEASRAAEALGDTHLEQLRR